MKINIMAAYSRLGSKVIEHLFKLGVNAEDIIGSVRSPEKAGDLKDKGIEIRKADYDDKDSLIEAFKGTDVLLLIPTFMPSEARITQYFNAIQAAKENNIKRIVSVGFISTTIESVFEIAPFLLYAETKIRQSGLDWTLIRDSLYLDSVYEAMPRILETGKWTLPVQTGKVSYIAKDDLGKAIAAVLYHDGHSKKTYSLTGKKAYALSEITDAISEVVGRKIIFEPETNEEYMERNKLDEMFKGILTLFKAIDNGEMELVTNHIEEITGTPPEDPVDFFRRMIK